MIDPDPHTLLAKASQIKAGTVERARRKSIKERHVRNCKALDLATLAFESHTGIMITDADNIILQVNQAFSRITGYIANEVIGKTPKLLHSGRQDADFYRALWQTVQARGFWQGELWNKRKNGEVYLEFLTISPIYNSRKQVSYYVGSFNDLNLISQLPTASLFQYQQLEIQLQQKNAELAQVQQELAEINTALKVIVSHQHAHQTEAKDVLLQACKQEIYPFLNQLKKAHHDFKQMALVRILETNLEKIMGNDKHTQTFLHSCQSLSPKEIQVASMIQQGLSSKRIAEILSTSTATISVHRKNIRKKLALNHQPINLQNFLASMD